MIVSQLAWTVFGITQEAKLWVPVKELPDWVTWRGTPHPKCGWHLLWTGVLAWIKRGKWTKDQHSSLLASWLRVQCDQSRQGPVTMTDHSHTVSQNQTFPSATTRKSHHCTAGMIPPIRETCKEYAVLAQGPKGSTPNVHFSCLTKILKRCWPFTTQTRFHW